MYFFIFISFIYRKFLEANSIDPDQTPRSAASIWVYNVCLGAKKRGARLIWAKSFWNLHFKQNWKVILSSSTLHKCFIYEPPHDKTDKMACAPSEDSDQPGHPPSLISLRFFAVLHADSEDSDQTGRILRLI